MLHFLILLQFINIFLTLTSATGGEYHRSDEENHAHFVEHSHTMLKINHLASYKVHDSMACGVQCLHNELCHSVNFAVESDDKGHICKLLKADRYKFPKKFERSNSYHHYSIAVRTELIIIKITNNKTNAYILQ